jgi:hypothetical protein
LADGEFDELEQDEFEEDQVEEDEVEETKAEENTAEEDEDRENEAGISSLPKPRPWDEAFELESSGIGFPRTRNSATFDPKAHMTRKTILVLRTFLF